ncbi:MAG: non-homologous end-joining DNA ligase [Xanthobacteraceae bacterium]|uniref:non-homologous end-joining DNA ligase n=1 Tax=Pseudolabrys sp. TaxID=1960880 RepID=UPI003D09E1B1
MTRDADDLPSFVKPQLATLVDAAPEGDDWIYETKFDGYRALASIGDGRVRIWTRSGLDWTEKFASLVAPLGRLPCRSALLDGEITVRAHGRTDFGALQNALSAGKGRLTYYVFDLLQLNGEDLTREPLRDRKALLKALLSKGKKSPALIYSAHRSGAGAAAFRNACKRGLEGIIAKRAGDPYRSARTLSWLKVKCGLEQEFVVIGWEPSDKKGRPFSSILLAVREKGKLRYSGRVGTGFSAARLDDLAALFARHARDRAPVPDVPRAIARTARFVAPVLVAEIAFRGWTADGLVRQGSFKGLRGDKPARAVVRERPKATAQATRRETKR